MIQFKEREKEVALPPFFCSISTDLMRAHILIPILIRGHLQMFTFSRDILTDTAKIMFYHLLTLSKWHIKLTITHFINIIFQSRKVKYCSIYLEQTISAMIVVFIMSFTSVVKFISKYFVLLYAIINGMLC